jgi:hypothetical protein
MWLLSVLIVGCLFSIPIEGERMRKSSVWEFSGTWAGRVMDSLLRYFNILSSCEGRRLDVLSTEINTNKCTCIGPAKNTVPGPRCEVCC